MPFTCARLVADAKLPFRKHSTDAGADVYAVEDTQIPPFSAGVVHTGITVEIPEGYALFAWPKGGSNYLIGAGVLDTGYQGEVLIKVVNYTPEPLLIEKGKAVAQLVKTPVLCEPVEEVGLGEIHTTASARGATGGIVGQ